ncbi:MAG TPA: hypothetical protein VEC38_03475 [Candidatus Binataceae bacterium]|nr:hypothetical protein [Candidatus Binataceae bacterium]
MNAGTAGSEDTSPRASRLFAIFAVEIVALNILWLPVSLDFSHFAFCDNGANLTAQFLISHGYLPTIDFGYHYGLLPLLIGRLWFGLFGPSAFAYQALMLACGLLIALALARIAAHLRLGRFGLALMVIALGFAVRASYPSLAQAVEAVLLSSALAEQAAGRRARALGFACAAVFAKPSMGFVYGALLSALVLIDAYQTNRRPRTLARFAIPAAVTGIALAVVLAGLYGPAVLVRTVLPIGGAAAYRALNFGFFTGAGREFWNPSGLSWMYYLLDVAGFWLSASVFLIGGGIVALIRWTAASSTPDIMVRRRDEIILTCAAVHVAFVLLIFGNRWSWIYYSYFLVAGVAAAADFSAWRRRISLVLCVLATLAWTDQIYWLHRWWQVRQPDAMTARLWSTADERDEWTTVLGEARGRRAAILDTKGAAELMFPEFENPVSLYLDPGWMNATEIQRKVAQISAANLVVVPMGIAACSGIPDAPEIRAAMTGFAPIFSGRHFVVYRRTPPQAALPGDSQ